MINPATARRRKFTESEIEVLNKEVEARKKM